MTQRVSQEKDVWPKAASLFHTWKHQDCQQSLTVYELSPWRCFQGKSDLESSIQVHPRFGWVQPGFAQVHRVRIPRNSLCCEIAMCWVNLVSFSLSPRTVGVHSRSICWSLLWLPLMYTDTVVDALLYQQPINKIRHFPEYDTFSLGSEDAVK